ncbi:hypothetical protein ACGYJ8_15410 [Sulfitobacter sp. 1A12126]|uniref:hypothetical protein n=1 Tax=Sulfitobacter sp. 1A12126 TaxID=3368591 RepID=UPI0037450436
MKWTIVLAAVALGAGCDQDLSDRRQVSIDGLAYTVYPGSRYPDVWYSSPTDRSLLFKAPPGIRAGNIKAIETASGCSVVDGTISQVDGISTSASVAC